MEDVMAMNVVKEVNGDTGRLFYELDGEGDADSSTTPSHNVDHHRDREYHQLLFYDVTGFNLLVRRANRYNM